jgi:predicted transposase YdaD
MKTDTLFYRLFQDRPALLFELTGLAWRAAAGYVWRAEEVKETAFRLDGVLVPEADLDAPLVFTEVQFQLDPAFYGRWLAEICLYLEDIEGQRILRDRPRFLAGVRKSGARRELKIHPDARMKCLSQASDGAS